MSSMTSQPEKGEYRLKFLTRTLTLQQTIPHRWILGILFIHRFLWLLLVLVLGKSSCTLLFKKTLPVPCNT